MILGYAHGIERKLPLIERELNHGWIAMIVRGGASLKIQLKLNRKLQWHWGMSIVLNVELPLIEREFNQGLMTCARILF